MSSTRKSTRFKSLLWLLTLAALLTAVYLLPVRPVLRSFIDGAADLGWPGILLFIALYALAAVLLIPASVLTLGAGLAFGLATGMLAVSAASTLGACLSFLISRYLARGAVERKFAGNSKFEALDEAVARQGWKIVFLLRLSPVFPYNVLNYLLGLTGIPFTHYAAASWLGMLPGTLLYVYLGYLGRSGLSSPADRWRWVYLTLGLLATLAVTFFIGRLASRTLKQQTRLPSEKTNTPNEA